MSQLRPLVTVSLLLLAALSWLADARPLPRIDPAESPAWEGQAVVVAGWAGEVTQQEGGGVRMTLRKDGHGLVVQARIGDVRSNDWVEATGQLSRLSGRLVLWADRLDVLQGPDPATPDWSSLGKGLEQYVGEPLALSGTLDDGQLHGPSDSTLRLGRGPWPPDGPASVVGVLRYDSACFCHRLDAAGSTWTP